MSSLRRPPSRPAGLPDVATILGRAGTENFTVASRLLPAGPREHLLAIYGYARLVDQLGDAYPGDRLAALEWVGAEVDLAVADPDRTDLHPLVTKAAMTVRRLGTDPQYLRDLIEANRVDQVTTRYATAGDLDAYCRLSANPVGRLVLAAFEVTTPAREAWSDQVCTGLQLAEHWQDVGEDARAGRIYLPADNRERFGVTEESLLAPTASRALRSLLVAEVARARRLLDEGSALVGDLVGHPCARLAIAGFVAGGYAALDAVAQAGPDGFDPLAHHAAPSKARTVRYVARLLRHPPTTVARLAA